MAALRPTGTSLSHPSEGGVSSVEVQGETLATAADDVRVWDAHTATATRVLVPPEGGVDALALGSPSGHTAHAVLAAVGLELLLYDVRAPQRVQHTTASCDGAAVDDISALALADDGVALAVADDSGDVRLMDLRRLGAKMTLRGVHTSLCATVAWRPGRNELCSGGLDAVCAVWCAADGAATTTWRTNEWLDGSTTQLLNPRFAFSVAYSPDGSLLATALGDGSIQLRDGGGNFYEDLEHAHAAAASRVVFAPQLARIRSLAACGATLALPMLSIGDDQRLCLLACDDDGATRGADDLGGKRQRRAEPAGSRLSVLDSTRLRSKPNDVAVTSPGHIYVAGLDADVDVYVIVEAETVD